MAFAKQWMKENNPAMRYTVLESIMSKNNRPALLSQRDWDVASTVIQWLGSTVGQAFLRDVMGEET